MTLRQSTGLRNKMMVTGSLRTTMNGGKILIYGGVVPATADDAITGSSTLLTTITVSAGATGITFEAVANDGILEKTAAEVWSGVNVASGSATFYRHVAAGDTAVLSTTEARIQGNVAVFGSELNLTSTTLASGATQTLDFYTVALPTL